MDIERPRRTSSTPTTTSELFICFTSRLSNSSSMRLTSKSILSPGRAGDKSAASLSLSSSLSRRLRHNGSLRGAQSPAMLKTRGGSGFENPEPSSPKVTCIGQVRVKTKKQGKKMKMRACRSKRLSSGEASFRRIEHSHDGGLLHQNSQGIQNQQGDRNQRWVHLPLTICEALRAFGSEFSCLLPCKSSCFSSCGGGKVKEREEGNNGGSCGAVFRWLVAMQEEEGGDGKERDIELVVGDEEDVESRERMVMGLECSSRRRSIFDDMEFKDEMEFKNGGDDDEEGARVSICIPPKNALLLMRCRSDPAKMSTLSHKVWEAPVAHDSDDEDGDEEEKEKDVKGAALGKMEEKTEDVCEKREKLGVGSGEFDGMCEDLVVADANVEQGHELGCQDLGIPAEEESEPKIEDEEETEEKQNTENRANTEHRLGVTPEEGEEETQLMEDENEPNRCSIDAITIRKMFEEGAKEPDWMENIKERAEISDLSSLSSSSSSSPQESTAESRPDEEQEEENDKEFVKSIDEQEEEEKGPPIQLLMEKEEEEEELQCYTPPTQRPEYPPEPGPTHQKPDPVLPDCLLLMMCEPKLSMEVSKETWVCSTDFIRWLPERHHSKKPAKTDGPDEPKKKKKAPPQTQPPPPQPARSSISFPAVEKAVKAGVGYEPFVLTRCKSAPMRSTAKIAATELACRENRRKMEPHRPATYGVGAAGVGF